MLPYLFTFLSILNWMANPRPAADLKLGAGKHPSAATDPAGTVHVVYGLGNVLYYSTTQTGDQFTSAIRLDSLPELQLGASRGPQIAASAQSIVILAIDKPGNIWSYMLDRATGNWQKRIRVNDVPEVAKEGFMGLTAGPDNSYMAAWLDLRGDKRNKLVGARSIDGGKTWSANEVLYASPDGTICECCQVSVVSQGRQVAILFRNFLNSYRDMYLLQSTDGGQTFGKAEKIGKGSWKLAACPMDGGGLSIDKSGHLSTVWRRADTLYMARPGQAETELATGKNAKIVSTDHGDYLVFQKAEQLWAVTPQQKRPVALGPGAYAKLVRLKPDRVLCIWEHEGAVWAKTL
ncbi:sialidase family protein [Spirosoma panaciterrae]|uniref:sialidase family protein n=1 Tax=Spirosoma panaciterrae TaxID=496058 RepID=UPI00035E17E2|nr:sialidase family protein [Spirosoma panaciterrae]